MPESDRTARQQVAMKESEIILHVGLHKTASTLLQRVVNASSSDFARQGLRVVPRDDFYAMEGVTGAIRGIHDGKPRPPKHMEEAGARIRKLLSPLAGERVLLSDETLLGFRVSLNYPGNVYECGIPALQWLASVLAPTPIRVVMYVRRQDRFVESMYLQNVHEGSAEPFAEWYAKLDIARFKWLRLVEQVESVVGRDRVAIRAFESIRDGAVPFCREFLRTIDASLQLTLPEAEVERVSSTANRGLSDKALQVALRAFPVLTVPERVVLRRFLQTKFSSVDYPKAQLLNDAQAESIMECHAKDNAVLFERYLPDLSAAKLGYALGRGSS
jgi:hypothetical protein